MYLYIMVEKTWKRMPTSSSLGLISDKISGWLDFSKWFTYKNQDLDSVHSSADEIRSLNRKRMEQYLWMEISKEEPSAEYVRDYAKSLTWERAKIADNLASQWYDFNESVAYLDNYERLRFANPMGTWLEIFQKKPVPFTESETWDTIKPWAEVWWTLLWLEWVWKWLETSWKKQYEKYVRPTQMDVNRMYKDAWNVWVYDDVTKKLEEQEKLIENMKSNWASPEEIAKEQEVYDTMKESRERYNNDKRKTTVDVANEKWIAWTELEMAEQAYRKRRTEWITEVEPKMVRSNARFNPVTDVLDTLWESDFNVTRELREKEYKPYLEELKEFYANEWEMSLRDLQEWRNKIDASRKFTETGEEVKNVASNVNDHIDRKLWEIIWDTLEKEYPWQWLREKVKDYWLMKEFEKAHAKRATSQLTKAAEKTPMDLKKRVKWTFAKIYDKIFWTNDISRQTKVWQFKQWLWWLIRPSKNVSRLWNYVKGNKKLMTLIWVWATVFNNPVAKWWLIALEAAWDVETAKDMGNFIERYRMYAPVVQRIHSRFADEDTRIWWEFAWMTEEEKEKKYPTEEVIKDLQWLSDNWYEDFVETYLQYEMPDILWWKTLKLADFDELWDYVWWRLKNVEEEDQETLASKYRQQRWLIDSPLVIPSEYRQK